MEKHNVELTPLGRIWPARRYWSTGCLPRVGRRALFSKPKVVNSYVNRRMLFGFIIEGCLDLWIQTDQLLDYCPKWNNASEKVIIAPTLWA